MPRTATHLIPPADAETHDRLRELATLWSPVRPLPIAAVVRECVRREYERMTKTKEKRR